MSSLTPKQVLSRFISSDYRRTKLLLQWLQACGIENNGELDTQPGASSLSIVDAAQAHFQRYYDAACQVPKPRTEIDIRAEDAGISAPQQELIFQALTNLGLFHYQYRAPERRLGCLLWHAAYLPELLLQIDTLVHYWERGVRWDSIAFLGAETSVGEDRPLDELLRISTNRSNYQDQLADVYNPKSLYWYAPNARLVEEIWNVLPMPSQMRKQGVRWIAAKDGLTPSGGRKLANTQDTFIAYEREYGFDPNCHYGLCSRAPAAVRQWIITAQFLAPHIAGFASNVNLPLICAPAAKPLSLYICGRETANVLWEVRKMRDAGIRWRV